MHTIQLKPFFHRGTVQLGIYYRPDGAITLVVRKIKGIKWSQTHRCWYLPLQQNNVIELRQLLQHHAPVDSSLIDHYQTKKQQVVSATDHTGTKPVVQSAAWKLSKENFAALDSFVQQLKLKGYSPSTIKTYRNEFLQLLQLLKAKHVNDLTPDDVKRYMVYCMEKEGIKENTAHSRINAIKFYFEKVLSREKFFWEIPRPKKAMQLPKVLNGDEVGRLFKVLTNKTHKAMLFTAYSVGLRVSEVVNLKISDIDSVRMQLFVERAKGKKDRYVGLSPVLLDILRNYIKTYPVKPKTYLFESEQTFKHYPTRTVQKIFQEAKRKAGIGKEVSFHSLRHSFGTHLLEKGTDIHYIKELLGHFDIRTTERYLHVSQKQLVNIVSPLDDLWNKGKIDW